MNKETVQGFHETQFSFPLSETNVVLRNIEKQEYDQIEYPNPYVVTIYFSTPDFRIPKSVYIRARCYLSTKFSAELNLKDDHEFWLEVKPKDLDERHKIKLPASYLTILDLLSNQTIEDVNTGVLLGSVRRELEFKPLIPYVATQYHRRHFVKAGLRITVDKEISAYGFFDGEIYNAEKILEDVDMGKFEAKTDLLSSKQNLLVEHLSSIGILSPTPHGQSERSIRKAYNKLFKEKNNY